MKISTIDIQAKEWFDKVNGNSYFSALVTVNFGMNDEQRIELPFQYGYGDHSKYMGFDAVEKAGLITDREKYANGSNEALFRYCERTGIILRYNKQTGCKKREL